MPLVSVEGQLSGSLNLAFKLSSLNDLTKLSSLATNSIKSEANVAKESSLSLSKVLSLVPESGWSVSVECSEGQDSCLDIFFSGSFADRIKK